MGRQAFGCGLACLQVQGHALVQQLGHRLRHRRQRGLEDQVVRKRTLADDLGRLQFTPGLGQVQRVHLQHRRGQLGTEIGAGQGGRARQPQRWGRQLGQAALHQRGHIQRLRQAAALVGAWHRTRQHQVLQGLQRKHRVAAGVLEQQRRQPRRVQFRQAERLDQRRQLCQIQRLQRARIQAPGLLQGAAQLRDGGTAVARPLRKAPQQRAGQLGLHQGLQQLDTRVVGKVQVINDHRVQAQRHGVAQGGVHRTLQQQALCRAGHIDGRTQFGQHQGQFLAAVGSEAEPLRRDHRAQQAGQQRARDAGVTRARLHHHHTLVHRRQFLQQAALADAGFTQQQEDPAGRAGTLQCQQVGLAADQARRAHQPGRHDRAARRQLCSAAFDGGHQLDGLGRRPRAQLLFQALLEVLEGGDGRGAVATQVVQPHQPALRVFGQRVAGDQALGVDQAAGHGAVAFAVGGGGGQGGVALFAPAAALVAQPVGQVRQVVVVQVAQQLRLARVFVIGDALDLGAQVRDQAGRQLQQGAGRDQRRLRFTAQTKQALAQAGVGLAGAGRRPQQGRHALGLDGAGQRHHGQQGSILGAKHDATLRTRGHRRKHQRGLAEQAQLPGQRGRLRVGGDGAWHAVVWGA